MSDLDKKITELEELRAKTTPGKWRNDGYHIIDEQGNSILEFIDVMNGSDRDCIVETHNTLPELIAAYKDMAVCAGLRGARIGCLEDDLANAIARAEKAEAEYNELMDRILEIGEISNESICPDDDTPCTLANQDCRLCWDTAIKKAAIKKAAKRVEEARGGSMSSIEQAKKLLNELHTLRLTYDEYLLLHHALDNAEKAEAERNILAEAIRTCVVYACDVCPEECIWSEPMLDIHKRPGSSLEAILQWVEQEAAKRGEVAG